MSARYRYNKKSGALQDAMVPASREPPIQQNAELSAPAPELARNRQMVNALGSVSAVEDAPDDLYDAVAPAMPAASRSTSIFGGMGGGGRATAPPPPPQSAVLANARDPQVNPGFSTMFFHTVEDGQRVLVVDRNGRVQVVEGPARVWRPGRHIRPMAHYVAHPGEFLVVRFRDGQQQHLAGPADCWFDPREHLSVEKEEAVQIAAKEAVVVYTEEDEDAVSRRIVHGPATFVPGPGEWLHTFRWHGPSPEAAGFQKVPGALVFQKLWLMPDQMYHDVVDVRTADDAVLTIRLMLFFELVDVERMLAATHDPIGDFVNAATSDVVDFVGRCTLDAFKGRTEALNDLDTYRQLTARAAQCGYRIDKVVYRGYGAPPALQRLQDQATESRVRLQLERATEEQAQQLEDYKLERSLERGRKQRDQQGAELDHRLALAEREEDAQRRRLQLDAESREAQEAARQARERAHLEHLSRLGVDLTALLTRIPADHTIELRGDTVAHLHLDGD